MELNQLRCFIAVAEELHFGKAAAKMNMMPASFGRFIKLLEKEFGQRLLNRSTRNVSLTQNGIIFLEEAIKIVSLADQLTLRFKTIGNNINHPMRIGAIDSAAAGLLPNILNIYRKFHPDLDIHLQEDKSINLIPRLKSGWLDIIFVRPPERYDSAIEFRHLTFENFVLAVPVSHPLATRESVTVDEIAQQSLILPERRLRPHSHDLSMSIFRSAGYQPRISQYADEKYTIVNLVSAGLGIAVVPAYLRQQHFPGVTYIRLELSQNIVGLPLSVAWMKGNEDYNLNDFLQLLEEHIQSLIKDL
ncbi:LysR family transcriptional regulator [Tatumella citrea]|uniref:Transcriptional regulator n=1 Tax=Tatumella citrea TaxID=53336 RepID=A0A1Y0LJH7_TATCI|nr:LysR family transcriptional regulator [Tatumella citrea]ARU93762.1 transcriptional regulator [Tatumella citrea]ARU97800.1 transcriptional regulator [Tatumella citrea]